VDAFHGKQTVHRTMQKFDRERFNLKKLDEVEGKK
jgi:hypothetical protein